MYLLETDTGKPQLQLEDVYFYPFQELEIQRSAFLSESQGATSSTQMFVNSRIALGLKGDKKTKSSFWEGHLAKILVHY